MAHRKELVQQISSALHQWEVGHGIVSPDHPTTSNGVQVASVQTLARRIAIDKAGRYKFDLVIVDEAHHAVANSMWGRILSHSADAH
ncbi:hypothetical protein CCP3SC15_1210008 [Gammaproteobacteria bacterium]